jgi:Tol biopolymer transport system component
VSDTNYCTKCGAELEGESCPACLLKLGLSGAIPPLREEPTTQPAEPEVSRRRRPRLAWAVFVVTAIVLLVIAAATLHTSNRMPEGPVIRFTISPPEGEGGDLALSPDGTKLAFTSSGREGQMRLWVHRMDSDQSEPLQGTEGAAFPFWSPDSRYIGFFAQRKLKSILVSGGGPLTLCDAPNGRGGTWNPEGVIIFASLGGLNRVPAPGGTPSMLRPPPDEFRSPSFLPDGRHFLVSARGVFMGDVDSGARSLLIQSAQVAVYSDGYVLFLRGGTLMAQPFDPVKLRFIGDARPIADGIRSSFSASDNGVLAYRNGDDPKTQLVWIDRAGKILGQAGEPGEMGSFALSPDGRTVAVARTNAEGGGSSLWLLDLARSTNMRLTFAPLRADSPVWSPDGSRVAFVESSQGNDRLHVAMANGGGQDEMLLNLAYPTQPGSWSRDGRFLAYTQADPKGKLALWMIPMGSERKPAPVLESAFNVKQGRISPDGRWIAYVSDETGRDEVYLQTFPPTGGKWLVSAIGGTHPEWRGDGKEVFFLAPNREFMAVDVAEVGQAIRIGIARVLFEVRGSGSYAVTSDGQKFLVKIPASDPESQAIHVILNWSSELRRQ